jgi:O-antigen/teichoic acid export membrane protein
MPPTQTESDHASHAAHRAAFFRQSGWMMISTVAGGAVMYAVHMIARRMPIEEYGVFTTLIQVITLMGIPGVGLQSVFAQQAAAALHEGHERELAGVFRGVLRAIFCIWLLMLAVFFVLRHQAQDNFKISNPMALWMTVIIGLPTMWFPIMMGMLQGRQNFLWLGWAQIVHGVGRFSGICVVVLIFGGWAAGATGAIFVGLMAALAIGAWQNWDYWRIQPEPIIWRKWLGRVVPLTFGLGAATFMLSADMLFVQWFFDKEQTGYYAAAGMIGRALVYFTQPMTAVMFPKVVRSAAQSKKTDVLAMTLGVTALAGGAAALACTILPSLPLRIVYGQKFLSVATPLVPWFAWCMLPLTMANVLISAMMARAQFKSVPWLVLVVIGYAIALYYRHQTFQMVIQTLGIFGLLMLGVCAWFTWGPGRPKEGSLPANPESATT